MRDILEVRNVGLSFENQGGILGNKGSKSKQILHNLNFSLKEHEFVSVIGDSGCGKSTLLRILAGYLAPSSGEVWFQSKIHNKPNPNIAVMFQRPMLYPWFNLMQNVALSAKMRGDSRSEYERIGRHYLKVVGLEKFDKYYPYECSGGMNARATLAQALACESRIILMDEPFAALDAFSKRNMQDLIRDIYMNLHSSVFFITHDIEEALYLSDRIFVMKPCNTHQSNIVEILHIDLIKDNREELERSKEFIDLKEYLYARIKEQYEYVI